MEDDTRSEIEKRVFSGVIALLFFLPQNMIAAVSVANASLKICARSRFLMCSGTIYWRIYVTKGWLCECRKGKQA